jgi:hypothetical protein
MIVQKRIGDLPELPAWLLVLIMDERTPGLIHFTFQIYFEENRQSLPISIDRA